MKTKNVKLLTEHFRQHMAIGMAGFMTVYEMKGYKGALRVTADNLADILKLDDPKFDRDKFLKESGF